jgi:hypothetical protein
MEDQKKFEYLVKDMNDVNDPQRQGLLNDLGKAGWRLVSSYVSGNIVTFVLARPLR